MIAHVFLLYETHPIHGMESLNGIFYNTHYIIYLYLIPLSVPIACSGRRIKFSYFNNLSGLNDDFINLDPICRSAIPFRAAVIDCAKLI